MFNIKDFFLSRVRSNENIYRLNVYFFGRYELFCETDIIVICYKKYVFRTARKRVMASGGRKLWQLALELSVEENCRKTPARESGKP